ELAELSSRDGSDAFVHVSELVARGLRAVKAPHHHRHLADLTLGDPADLVLVVPRSETRRPAQVAALHLDERGVWRHERRRAYDERDRGATKLSRSGGISVQGSISSAPRQPTMNSLAIWCSWRGPRPSAGGFPSSHRLERSGGPWDAARCHANTCRSC